MTLPKIDIDRFLNLSNIPTFIQPWLDRFFEDVEIELVLLLGQKPLHIDEVSVKWRLARANFNPDKTQAFLERCYKRGIIVKRDDGRLQPADFHARFDIWSMFEGWKDLPDEIRDRLNGWELEYYQEKHVDQIDSLKKDERGDASKTWPAYLLLHEAEALIDRVDHVYLWPCNCRAMMEGCQKNLYTCLRFSNDRDWGWEISKSRAKGILRQANKSGLMQNGEVALAPDGSITGAICNCCEDCCFPQQLAERLDAGNLWPLTRYKADFLKNRCTGCGRCVNRCPFGAFAKKEPSVISAKKSASEKKQRPEILFDHDLCRGCGVCSTGCPENAIDMVRLENINWVWEKILQWNDC